MDILEIASSVIAEGNDVHSRVLAAISELDDVSIPHCPVLGVKFRYVSPPTAGNVPERYVSPPNVPSVGTVVGAALQGEALRAAAIVRLQLREAGLYSTPGRPHWRSPSQAAQENSAPPHTSQVLSENSCNPTAIPVVSSQPHNNPNFDLLQTRLRAASSATTTRVLNTTLASSNSVSPYMHFSVGDVSNPATTVFTSGVDLSSLEGDRASAACLEVGEGDKLAQYCQGDERESCSGSSSVSNVYEDYQCSSSETSHESVLDASQVCSIAEAVAVDCALMMTTGGLAKSKDEERMSGAFSMITPPPPAVSQNSTTYTASPRLPLACVFGSSPLEGAVYLSRRAVLAARAMSGGRAAGPGISLSPTLSTPLGESSNCNTSKTTAAAPPTTVSAGSSPIKVIAAACSADSNQEDCEILQGPAGVASSGACKLSTGECGVQTFEMGAGGGEAQGRRALLPASGGTDIAAAAAADQLLDCSWDEAQEPATSHLQLCRHEDPLDSLLELTDTLDASVILPSLCSPNSASSPAAGSSRRESERGRTQGEGGGGGNVVSGEKSIIYDGGWASNKNRGGGSAGGAGDVHPEGSIKKRVWGRGGARSPPQSLEDEEESVFLVSTLNAASAGGGSVINTTERSRKSSNTPPSLSFSSYAVLGGGSPGGGCGVGVDVGLNTSNSLLVAQVTESVLHVLASACNPLVSQSPNSLPPPPQKVGGAYKSSSPTTTTTIISSSSAFSPVRAPPKNWTPTGGSPSAMAVGCQGTGGEPWKTVKAVKPTTVAGGEPWRSLSAGRHTSPRPIWAPPPPPPFHRSSPPLHRFTSVGASGRKGSISPPWR